LEHYQVSLVGLLTGADAAQEKQQVSMNTNQPNLKEQI
jgi:hypothetical protein